MSGLTGANSQLFTQDSPGVGSAVEQSDQFGQTLAAGDFNDSGTEDLAVGAAFESVGVVEAAGAVNVLYGRPVTGLTGANSQLFPRTPPAWAAPPRSSTPSGCCSPAAISTPTAPTTWRSGCRSRPWARFWTPARSTSSMARPAG